MKIAFLAESFLPDKSTGINGSQVQMYNLALAFKKAGLDIHYISLSNVHQRIDEFSDGITLHWIPHKDYIFSWYHHINIFNTILDQVQPDIIYQRGRSPLTYMAAKWSQTHKIKFIWGTNADDCCEYWKNTTFLNKTSKALWRKVLLFPEKITQDILIHKGMRDADQVVNQTYHQKNRLSKNFNKTGIVLPSYFLPPSATESYKKEKIVLWIANLTREKQPELFIKFAEQNQDLEWKFILGGGTPDKKYWQSLLDQAAQLKNIKIIGRVAFEDNQKYFSQASLFVNTCFNEGISNTFVQAWLNRTPVLSFNHDPNDWIKTYNLGYCAHGNEEQFLHHGRTLLENYEQIEAIKENCQQFALKTFAAKETIDSYLKLFRL